MASYAEFGGIPCSVGAPFWAPPTATAATLPWPDVWLGHFSGGHPYESAPRFIDWVDEKICFPARIDCQAWMSKMRRAYHHPEGYWTCMLLR